MVLVATEIQYNFFKALYDEEFSRYRDLEARARLYLSILTLYLGAFAFKIEDLDKFVVQFRVPAYWLLPPALMLVTALFLTILAMRIRNYEGICDPEEVIDGFGDKPPGDDDFLDDRLVDLAVATNRNVDHNNRAANLLHFASIWLAAGIILHGLVIGFAAVREFRGG